MLDNNDHPDPVRLIGVVYIVDSAFGAAASGLDSLGASGSEIDIACRIDSRVDLTASNSPSMLILRADIKEAM
jgi:hypothetical protein